MGDSNLQPKACPFLPPWAKTNLGGTVLLVHTPAYHMYCTFIMFYNLIHAPLYLHSHLFIPVYISPYADTQFNFMHLTHTHTNTPYSYGNKNICIYSQNRPCNNYHTIFPRWYQSLHKKPLGKSHSLFLF